MAYSSATQNEALEYKITHVFCPPCLPNRGDGSPLKDRALSNAVYSSAQAYSEHISSLDRHHWYIPVEMLRNLNDTMCLASLDEDFIVSQLGSMKTGGVLAYLIRAQNAVVVVRRQPEETVIESFEASPRAEAIMNTCGKLISFYPGPAIAIPHKVFDDALFRAELANFLASMVDDDLPVPGKMANEACDTPHPRHITELLTGILRGVGKPAETRRVSKRIGDDVVSDGSQSPWRRSPLWLLIRVVLQTTLEHIGFGIDIYKAFMLFFMDQLTRQAVDQELCNDVLHWTSSKISRRLTKLGSLAPERLEQAVMQTCRSVRTLLDARWKNVQDEAAHSSPWNPSELDFSRDTRLTLRVSGEYISRVLNFHHSSSKFRPENHLRGTLPDFLSANPQFPVFYKAEPHLALYDVEQEVSRGIDGWVTNVSDRLSEVDECCEMLERLASDYSSAAKEIYKDNPEGMSRMLLTMVELWIGLDKLVRQQIPIFAEYSPEIPISLLEQLLVWDGEGLVRIRQAYEYIRNRHTSANNGWSVFSSYTHNSFALRYYDNSPHLSRLMSRIVDDAQSNKNRKLEELAEENKRYDELRQRASYLEHNHKGSRCTRNVWGQPSCEKCNLESQATDMKIEVHEWPLPSDSRRAAIVIFELDCPVSFNMWRTVTRRFIDLCSPPPSCSRGSFMSLRTYRDLLPYYEQHRRSRITLAYNRMSFRRPRYHNTSIPSEESIVCVSNGLDFYLFDVITETSASDSFDSIDVSSCCSYLLPPGPYEDLQDYLRDTSHTSNDVLASQTDCHKDLSIHESIAFGHLRSGPSLQWLNILREIRANVLRFQHDEVHLLLAQASGQIGPISHTGEFTWHHELEHPAFCQSLLCELKNLLSPITGDSQVMVMGTASLLICRILANRYAVEGFIDTSDQAYQLLNTIREKTFSWVTKLIDQLGKARGDAEEKDLSHRLRDVAAICRSTFDIGSFDAGQLFDPSGAVEILLSCAIVVQDNIPADSKFMSYVSRLLLKRDRRLSYKLERAMIDAIKRGDEGIDLAIRHVWPAYHKGTRWQSHPASDSWFTTTTASIDGRSYEVGVHILHGTLLVNGRPMGKLPARITEHPTFNLIFDNRKLAVVPVDVNGMEYATRVSRFGHQIYFGMAGNELVIRAKDEECGTELELIPSNKFKADLPIALVEGHVFWLNRSTKVIEVRPLQTMWKGSERDWRIQISSEGNHSMTKDNYRLFDIHSQTWSMISQLLEPLEDHRNMTITFNHSTQTVFVHLPRFGLSFFINSDEELECHHPRGTIYDTNQSIGTLFGLRKKLVLRLKTTTVEGALQRLVLVPEGDISYTRHSHHVQVKVHTSVSVQEHITYYTFGVNHDLGCLTGNTTLASNLYRAYLHALCSNPCAVDPLTKKTGTEEALSILRSAACQSFINIDVRAANLVHCIASLTTGRKLHRRSPLRMQEIEWASLPVASQHHGFYQTCLSIRKRYHDLQSLLLTKKKSSDRQPDLLFDKLPERDEYLLRRASLRCALLYPPEYRDPLPQGNHDVVYGKNDFEEFNFDELRAYGIAHAIFEWRPQQPTADDIHGLLESWEGKLVGTSIDATIPLRYRKEWLQPALSYLWLRFYNTCRGGGRNYRFQLLFSLSAMVYGSPELKDAAFTLLAFATIPQFRFESPPTHADYDLADGYTPSPSKIAHYVSLCAVSYEESPEEFLEEYRERLQHDQEAVVTKMSASWPCWNPPVCDFLNRTLYNIEMLRSSVSEHFASCYRNLALREYLQRVQSVLDQNRPPTSEVSHYTFIQPNANPFRTSSQVDLQELFRRSPPTLPSNGMTLQIRTAPLRTSGSSKELERLIETLRHDAQNANDLLQIKYADDLNESEKYLDFSESFPMAEALRHSIELFRVHYSQSRAEYFSSWDVLAEALGPRSASELALSNSGQWPRITPKSLLSCLSSTSKIDIPLAWRNHLISLARFSLEHQRSRRMLLLATNDQFEELSKEIENTGCSGWEAETHTDWLLIQLEGDFLIRHIQANVASEMIAPQSGENTALQLHMGEGKSSVIVPIVASALADGNRLVRVVVPKALVMQTFRLLVDRLAGLANRRIYYLPFSRSLHFDDSTARISLTMLEECMRERGILVVQPDHVLSFKLLSVEKQLGSVNNVANQLLRTQRWLHLHARDILDESDELLHVRNQLVYTIDSQRPFEGFPKRWSTTQRLLGLVSRRAAPFHAEFPAGLEYDDSYPGTFPYIRILDSEAGHELLEKVASDVSLGLHPEFHFAHVGQDIQNAIYGFIAVKDVMQTDVQLVKDYSEGSSVWTGLLHLRGLLALGVLHSMLKEWRWRVNFGLAPWRTMLAVPYRAKDVPSTNAEFGHPDVIIILTCLSYYYGGLTEEQLRQCFDRIFRQDDPQVEYESWVRPCLSVPNCPRDVNGVDIRSPEQWKNVLFPTFSRNKATIDFYLSQVVFPMEAVEFPYKLSCTSWDLAEKRTHVTTGFSGTNDCRYLLPATITQRDPDHQRGTNAKMLAYLLQPENDEYLLVSRDHDLGGTALQLIHLLVNQEPEIRVVLDVGAQVLELQNDEFAAAWLNAKPDARAALYFNTDDELMVLTREGNVQLLIESPFAHQLDECVVYLDDAHTRGTDIKFPVGFRAAVTLGPKVTKDRLAQGCMRMRKLGNGHSLVFIAPPEVDRSIRTEFHKNNGDAIHTSDILRWTILETCREIRMRAPHWAQQRRDHILRYEAWSKFCADEISSDKLADAWRQPAGKTLEKMYAPMNSSGLPSTPELDINPLFLELGIICTSDSDMDRDQEMEVMREIEREQEVQKAGKISPAKHQVDDAVRQFVRTGLVQNPLAFCPIFDYIASEDTFVNKKEGWSQLILATSDFQRVVQSSEHTNQYLRPVSWILSSFKGSKPTLVVLSPFEVNTLLPDIRRSRYVHLHIYTPRIHEAMTPCDDLVLYTVPPVPSEWTAPIELMDQVSLFAGQLYLRDYSTYTRLCCFLSIYASDLQEYGDIQIHQDGFIEPANSPPRALSTGSFHDSPLPFLKYLIGFRRKGMDFALTQVGKILDGGLLEEEDFRTISSP